MLGTNDFQSMHDFNAWHSAQGTARLINEIRRANIEPGMPVPTIVVMASPTIKKPHGPMAKMFENAEIKSRGLAGELQTVAELNNCSFFNVANVTVASRMDGIHLDSDQHVLLGRAMAKFINKLF